jgi:hypothetical protein
MLYAHFMTMVNTNINILELFLSRDLFYCNNNITGATSGAETVIFSGASDFTPFYGVPGFMLILTWVGIIFVIILHRPILTGHLR